MISWKMKYMDDMVEAIRYKTNNNKERRRTKKEAKSIAKKLTIEAKRRLRYPPISELSLLG